MGEKQQDEAIEPPNGLDWARVFGLVLAVAMSIVGFIFAVVWAISAGWNLGSS